jgi:cytochrome c551
VPNHLRSSLVTALVLSLAGSLALGACAGTPLPPLASPAAAGGAGGAGGARTTAELGRELFNGRVEPAINCYRCHNGDGTGTWRGPNLTKRVPGLTDAEIASTIIEGPGFMPSFKGKVSDAQIGQLVAWLRERFPQRL